LEALGAGPSHCDGWGYAVYAFIEEVLKLFHYKTLRPIHEDYEALNQLLKNLDDAEYAMGFTL